jgi:uncharacterized protein (TIGR02466 family)
MFDDKDTIHIFPYSVWLFNINADRVDSVNQKAHTAIEHMRQAEPAGIPGAHWQSPNDLQGHDDFAELVETIRGATKEIFSELRIPTNDFLVTGMWVNLRPPGTQHPAHTHPNNYLSGTYYVTAPAGGDAIVFRDPRVETNIIAPQFSEQTDLNAREIMVPVKPGMLVMFPSWLPHFVPPNQGNVDRISISFNVMFESYGETISRPKWTFNQGTKGS